MTDEIIKPLAVPATQGFRIIGIGASKGWELIAAKKLDAFHIGRRTLVTVASIEKLIASAPRVERREKDVA